MSRSDDLEELVRVNARILNLPIEEAWVPAISLHLERLLAAAAVLDQSGFQSNDFAPRFDP